MREIASNNTDFVIADELKNEYILLLGGRDDKTGEYINLHISKEPFDIENLCEINKKFELHLKSTLSEIDKLERNNDFISNSLKKIQNFISKQMPMPLDNVMALYDRNDALMENEPFSYFVENGECMCSERAAMAQYMLQQIGIKSYYVGSFSAISGVNRELELHSYIIFENKGQMFVYDPANPRTDENHHDVPRILDTNMNKTIFGDFVEAVNYNSEGKKIEKKRVGFKCVDPINNQIFVYCSQCGVKGETTSPKKLKEKRYGNPFPAQQIYQP